MIVEHTAKTTLAVKNIHLRWQAAKPTLSCQEYPLKKVTGCKNDIELSRIST